MTEHDLMLRFVEYFSLPKRAYATEVPALNRVIDLVYKADSDIYCSVEFKLRNWRRAVRQATDHSIVADQSFICMPSAAVTDDAKQLCRDKGIGIFVFRENECAFEQSVMPSHRPPMKPFKERMSGYFELDKNDRRVG